MKPKGRGFLSKDGKRVYLERCFDCARENWAMAVSSGQCAWCGVVAKKEDLKEIEHEATSND